MGDSNNNPMIAELSKFKGVDVVVTVFSAGSNITMVGKCAAIDFGSKAIVLEKDGKKFLIPRYVYVERDSPGVRK